MSDNPELEADWATRLSLSIAAEVKRQRARLGISAQQLADRCAELGMPIQRSVLSNLETGRRSTVNVAELLVLAAALQVPPAALIYSADASVPMEVLPGLSSWPLAGVEWVSGRMHLPGTDIAYYHAHPLFALRRHEKVALELDAAIGDLVSAQKGLVEARKRYAAEEQALRQARDRWVASERRRDQMAAYRSAAKSSSDPEALADAYVETAQAVEGLAIARRQLEALEGAKVRSELTERRVQDLVAELVEQRIELESNGITPPTLTDRVRLYIGEMPIDERNQVRRIEFLTSEIPSEG